jgi:hypothetical protein
MFSLVKCSVYFSFTPSRLRAGQNIEREQEENEEKVEKEETKE